jgi:hypothetical protein
MTSQPRERELRLSATAKAAKDDAGTPAALVLFKSFQKIFVHSPAGCQARMFIS